MRLTTFMAAMLAATTALATDDEFGTTNPEELTWQSMRDRAEQGDTHMMVCASGYLMTKSGDHDTARLIFEQCADDGYTAAMSWMSYMEQNGFGGEFNPDAAAEWDRKAAELGDPVGKFNHGLNLIRGFGIEQDEEEGRRMVDEAAEAGIESAQRLRDSGYDLDEVTPDADNWRYAPLF